MQWLLALLVRAALAGLRILDGLKEPDEVLEPPGMIRDARSDGRSRLERRMNPREVVVREVERDRADQVLKLLAVCVGEAREAAHAHPHGQVLALDVAGGDRGRIGAAAADANVDPSADGRAIPGGSRSEERRV